MTTLLQPFLFEVSDGTRPAGRARRAGGGCIRYLDTPPTCPDLERLMQLLMDTVLAK